MSSLFDTPDPPNPQQTAAAQTGTNVSTAVANANLGNVNQVTPQGNLTYNQTDNYNWTDPSTGQTYTIPKFTATQTLSPTGQATFDQSQAAQYNLAATGAEQAARLRNQFNTPMSLAGAPAFGDVNTLSGAPQAQTLIGFDPGQYLAANPDVAAYAQANGLNPEDVARAHYDRFGQAENRSGGTSYGDVATTFGASPETQLGYQHGDDFSADRQRIEEGLMGRINPSLQQERNKYEQQLADQGIQYGSPAYENAMRNYSMQANDARFAAIAQGGQEQQRLSDIARQAGEFHNASAQQQYEQLFGRGQFYNAGQQQDFSQAAQRGTFANAAQAQNFQQAQSAFNASNAARQQYLNETFALRNQPINEISALLSGSQVSSPNFLNTQGPTIPTTDVAGLINRNFDQQMAVSNQQAATANNIIGGLFGFAGGLGRGGAFNK